MSVENFIRAMPKVDLHVRLEGAIQRETLLMLADQNEIRDQIRRFDKWIEQYRSPDFKKLDELLSMLRSWIQHDDDLVRAVYDVGVTLSKDNVRYAEIGVDPLAFVTNDFTFDEFLNALNDGRDRAERAWGIQMRWVILIPRNEPRRADEVARWATSATARRGGVVAMALAGYDKHVSLDQFERAFRTADKKDIARIAYLNEKDDVDEAIDMLSLNGIVDAWGVVDSPETLALMQSSGIPLSIGLYRARAYSWINDFADYPLQAIRDAGVKVSFSSDMPTLFKGSLSDEYLAAYQSNLLSVQDLEEMSLMSLEEAHLPDEEREALQAIFQVEYEVLKSEHLSEDEVASSD